MPQFELNLKQSPMFAMSLAAKELFHSNFIAYIMENHPIFFTDIMNHLSMNVSYNIGTSAGNDKVCRENNHTDISIRSLKSGKNGNIVLGDFKLIIENKLKSIPYEEQLNKYSSLKGVTNNTLLVLLTMYLPTGLNNCGNLPLMLGNWHVVTYEQFIKSFDVCLPIYMQTLTCSNAAYLNNLFTDYSFMIHNLIDYFNRYADINSSSDTIAKICIDANEQANGLRLYDASAKMRASKMAGILASELEIKLKAKGYSCGFDGDKSVVNTYKQNSSQVCDKYIYVFSGYGQVGPFFECYVPLGNDYIFDIMVQNTQINIGVINYNPNRKTDWGQASNDLSSQLNNIIMWVNKKSIPVSIKSNGINRTLRINKGKGYYQFTDLLFEKWDVTTTTRLSDIINFIVDTIDRILP